MSKTINEVLVLLMNMFLSTGYAKEFKGSIINFVQDDEGVKVILDNKDAVKESVKKQPQICYLRNDHPNFAEILMKIQEWKLNQSVIRVNSNDDQMPLIKEISELKK